MSARTSVSAIVVLLCLTGPTRAQSLVDFTLELGGDNQGIGCSGTIAPFIPGSTVDGQVFQAGDVITWATQIRAFGTQAGGDSAGYECRGLAGFAFDLELRESTPGSPLVDEYIFFSTVNDGSGGCPSACAAFVRSFSPYGFGPGRIIDPVLEGGVNMSDYAYPLCEAGALRNMRAAYASWSRQADPRLMTVGGVGQVPPDGGDPTAGPLGVGPFCEGQIDTSNLAGIYTLTIIPLSGITVLRGDVNLGTDQPDWDDLADATSGDMIVFEVAPCSATITGWRSVHEHGSCGDLGIPLDPTDGVRATTEPRLDGVERVQVDFDGDVTGLYMPGQVIVSGGLVVVDETLLDGGQTLEIQFAGSTDMSCYEIDLSNSVMGLTGDATCLVATLEGDANNDGCVTVLDRAITKLHAGEQCGDPRVDFNHDGVISSLDRAIVKLRSGNCVTCP